MFINKFKTQKLEVVKKNQPDLHLFLATHFNKETPELQGKIAGAIIEYVIQSQGNVSIFDDKASLTDNEEFDFDTDN